MKIPQAKGKGIGLQLRFYWTCCLFFSFFIKSDAFAWRWYKPCHNVVVVARLMCRMRNIQCYLKGQDVGVHFHNTYMYIVVTRLVDGLYFLCRVAIQYEFSL